MTQLNMDLASPSAQSNITPTHWQEAISARWLSSFDVAMAHWMARHVADAPPELLWLTALLARQSGQGHVRLELADVLANPAHYGLQDGWPAHACLTAHQPNSLHAVLADSPAVALATRSPQPLVLDDGALYWQRAWREECDVAEQLRARLDAVLPLDDAALEQLMAELSPAGAASDDQRAACRLAAQRALTVITGGPGTGKTTTVVRVLAILQSLSLSSALTPLRIALVAPTGKAAARLSESIASQIAALPIPEASRAAIPSDVSTVHRLLGVLSAGNGRRYRHHAGNPLALDLLVVDEASMLDLSLMAALLDALPASARVILLGDQDQLASVEAGAVLADICAAESATAHVAQLRQSYRFDGQRGIGKLAHDVRSGLALNAPQDDTYAPEVRRIDDPATLFRGYDDYWALVQAQAPAEEILSRFGQFRLLCALRDGRHGVVALNTACARYLRQTSAYDTPSVWYVGRPIMITRNDYSLNVMNGDIGICLKAPGSDVLRVAFWDARGQTIRWILPSRLPSCESVFAMTVHKSQGSEFQTVAVVLPSQHSPVLSRELIYTALTRARECVQLCIPVNAVWRQTVDTQAQRFSGLRRRLQSRRAAT